MRFLRVLAATALLVPFAMSFPDVDLPLALACTGAPTYSADAIVIVPDEGATVPRNARVLFFASGATSMFAVRPTEPAELRTGGTAIPIVGRDGAELRPARLEADTTYDLWLPNGLEPPLGKAPPVLEKTRTFRTSAEDDRTPPRIRSVGRPVYHPTSTSCGPFARFEVPIDVEDASAAFVEAEAVAEGAVEERRSSRTTRVRIVKGAIVVPDTVFYTAAGQPIFPTHLLLTPVDIAGNRGATYEVSLHRLADGGAEPAVAPTTERPRSRGCGKY